MIRSILVTGEAGYIGSHISLALLQGGFDIVVLYNLCNSSVKSLRRVGKFAGRTPNFVVGDIRNRKLLDQIIAQHPVYAVCTVQGESIGNLNIPAVLEYRVKTNHQVSNQTCINAFGSGHPAHDLPIAAVQCKCHPDSFSVVA